MMGLERKISKDEKGGSQVRKASSRLVKKQDQGSKEAMIANRFSP